MAPVAGAIVLSAGIAIPGRPKAAAIVSVYIG